MLDALHFRPNHFTRFAAVMLALASVACSSSSGSGPAMVPAPAPSKLAGLARATVRIVIPPSSAASSTSARRGGGRRAYISPATQSIVGTFAPSGGGTPVVVSANLSVQNNANCQGTIAVAQTCTITFAIAPGAYTAGFVTYDQPLASGSTAPPGNALSENQSFPITIVSGTTNMIPVALDGIPAQVLVRPSTTTGLGGNQLYGFTAPNCIGLEHETLSVIALDADGNYILGIGAPTPSLASSSASITIGTPSAQSPNVFLLSGPKSPSQFGAGGSSATLTASVTTPPATASGGGITPTIAITANINVALIANCSVVTTPTDTAASANDATSGATSVPGLGTGMGTGTGAAASGDLRYVMLNAPAGNVIVFSLYSSCTTATPCTVHLQGPLPPIVQNQTIDGGSDTAIDGGAAATSGTPGYPGFRAFFVETGDVTIRNVVIQNALAAGGNGGNGFTCGGGGGLGAGAGLFVNSAAADVLIVNVAFANMTAQGGNGGNEEYSFALPSAAGGGGLGGSDTHAKGMLATDGGGGVLGPSNGANGGYGGGGSGGAGDSSSGVGGAAYAGEPAGTTSTTAVGGDGGFGGGGGGGYSKTSGAGGFGGGGGCSDQSPGGSGGFGGGGGATPAYDSSSGPGGFDGGAGAPAGSGLDAGGGGGAALGPAIFVNAGHLTVADSSVSGPVTAVAGTPGDNATGGTADATPVFVNTGSVNGQTLSSPGGVPGVLPTAAP